MKLFTKIFLCSILVFSVAFQLAGYLLISFSYEDAILQEKKYALSQYQYSKYVLQSSMYMNGELSEKQLTAIAQNLNTPVGFYHKNGENLYSNLTYMENQPGRQAQKVEIQDILDSYLNTEENTITCKVQQDGAKSKMFLCGQVVQDEISMFLVIETDIGNTIMNQRTIMDYFQKLYLVILCFAFVLIFLLSMVLTKPINRISSVAKSIAGGNYGERIPIARRDELGELAENFNHMADAIEEKIDELSEAARRKDEFVANFAHEMKTPLTSVIGYADMLYQKELPRETVKEASGYIFREGMRLEMLSLKMMDLIVLKRQDFELELFDSGELFRDIRMGLTAVCENRGARLHCDVENIRVWVEYDFLKTMIVNLIDNALKADSTDVWVTGKCVCDDEQNVYDEEGKNSREKDGNREKYAFSCKTKKYCEKHVGSQKNGRFQGRKQNGCEMKRAHDKYQVTVRDNGRGIPEGEISRIKEAFYMVDKSRSRKQHGAGLGLALSEQIANIHGTSLQLENNEDVGISVSFYLMKGEKHV